VSGYEVGARAPLRALHRLPWADGPEGELHLHDYLVEVVVGREELDERGMVCDLDVLQPALAAALARLDGKDLDEIVPTGAAEAVTVEVLARWLHEALADAVGETGASDLAVRVWESETAFGGYAAAVSARSSSS
jgi:6-pyruvoyl-tetrahydropterin synthase